MKFAEWLAASPLASALKTFVAVVMTMAIADWSTKGGIDFAAWQTWVIAAAVSAVPMIVNWLNPADTRYGNGSGFTADIHDVFGTDDKDPSA